MKPPVEAFIPVMSSPWASQSHFGQVCFENGGASLPGGLYEPRYMLVHPSHYALITVALKSSPEVKGYDWLYLRAGGLKADIAPMDRPFSVLFFKDDATSTRALYERYRWELPHEEFKAIFHGMEFPVESTVEDIKTLMKEKLGEHFKRSKKS